MQLELKNTTQQGLADPDSYRTPAILGTISLSGVPAGQATFRYEKDPTYVGYWLVTLHRTSGPTDTDYSYKLYPGEPVSEEEPPIGEVWAMASADCNGPLSWYLGWKQ